MTRASTTTTTTTIHLLPLPEPAWTTRIEESPPSTHKNLHPPRLKRHNHTTTPDPASHPPHFSIPLPRPDEADAYLVEKSHRTLCIQVPAEWRSEQLKLKWLGRACTAASRTVLSSSSSSSRSSVFVIAAQETSAIGRKGMRWEKTVIACLVLCVDGPGSASSGRE
ncbi:hypothetical protein EJ03DRAFT_79532 [Teratosphaeria nubilosa]|uniref:Uncharacterized protein n=1 Tax=Teratosphaeria nubilosa TaxID=161662 RepID=A0A6G1LAX1_9PEZI|nr:hypothetical protein EJ03DRAFT_79532 [Teratosphaeria nubilosa]